MSSIKLVHGNEIRRLSHPFGTDAPLTMTFLQDLVIEIFSFQEDDSIKISWIDDENEKIQVSTDPELHEAIRVMIWKMRSDVLKFIIEKLDYRVPTCTECHLTMRGLHFRCSVREKFDLCLRCEQITGPQPYPMVKFYSSTQSLFDISVSLSKGNESLQKLFLRHNSSGSMVHRGLYCSMCGVEPIRGFRYKCLIRENFDMCHYCEASRAVKSPVLKIYCTDQCQLDSVKLNIDSTLTEYYIEKYTSSGESISNCQPTESVVETRSNPNTAVLSSHHIAGGSPEYEYPSPTSFDQGTDPYLIHNSPNSSHYVYPPSMMTMLNSITSGEYFIPRPARHFSDTENFACDWPTTNSPPTSRSGSPFSTVDGIRSHDCEADSDKSTYHQSSPVQGSTPEYTQDSR